MKNIVALTVVTFVACSSASAELVRTNGTMIATWDERDGTLASLVLSGDPDRMNWIEGTDRWGTLRYHRNGVDWKNMRDMCGDTTRFEFVGLRQEGGAAMGSGTPSKTRLD